MADEDKDKILERLKLEKEILQLQLEKANQEKAIAEVMKKQSQHMKWVRPGAAPISTTATTTTTTPTTAPVAIPAYKPPTVPSYTPRPYVGNVYSIPTPRAPVQLPLPIPRPVPHPVKTIPPPLNHSNNNKLQNKSVDRNGPKKVTLESPVEEPQLVIKSFDEIMREKREKEAAMKKAQSPPLPNTSTQIKEEKKVVKLNGSEELTLFKVRTLEEIQSSEKKQPDLELNQTKQKPLETKSTESAKPQEVLKPIYKEEKGTDKLVDTKPAEIKALETKPVETKPVEIRTLEAKPVESKQKAMETKTEEPKSIHPTKPVDPIKTPVVKKEEVSKSAEKRRVDSEGLEGSQKKPKVDNDEDFEIDGLEDMGDIGDIGDIDDDDLNIE